MYDSLGRSLLPVLLLVLFTGTANSQIGTITQDIATVSAFALQKDCAKSCFLKGSYCPYDVLGSAIGCAAYDCKSTRGYEAKNDCYCRQDLQNPAQAFLTDCIQSRCTVGDQSVDAASAGSIYGQYCKDKGYAPPTAPATIPAIATGPGGIPTRTFAPVSQPTSPGSSGTTQQQPTPSSQISMTTIIAIVVGSVIGLILLAMVVRRFWRRRPARYPLPMNHTPPQPQASHTAFHQAPSYPTPISQWQHSVPPPSYTANEVSPDDSVSVVGPAGVAPTLVSGAQGHTRYNPFRK